VLDKRRWSLISSQANTLRAYYTSVSERSTSELPPLSMTLDFLTSLALGVNDLDVARTRLLSPDTVFDGATREEIEEHVLRGVRILYQRRRSTHSESIYGAYVAWRQSENAKGKVRPDHNGLRDDVDMTPYTGPDPQGSWRKA